MADKDEEVTIVVGFLKKSGCEWHVFTEPTVAAENDAEYQIPSEESFLLGAFFVPHSTAIDFEEDESEADSKLESESNTLSETQSGPVSKSDLEAQPSAESQLSSEPEPGAERQLGSQSEFEPDFDVPGERSLMTLPRKLSPRSPAPHYAKYLNPAMPAMMPRPRRRPTQALYTPPPCRLLAAQRSGFDQAVGEDAMCYRQSQGRTAQANNALNDRRGRFDQLEWEQMPPPFEVPRSSSASPSSRATTPDPPPESVESTETQLSFITEEQPAGPPPSEAGSACEERAQSPGSSLIASVRSSLQSGDLDEVNDGNLSRGSISPAYDQLQEAFSEFAPFPMHPPEPHFEGNQGHFHYMAYPVPPPPPPQPMPVFHQAYIPMPGVGQPMPGVGQPMPGVGQPMPGVGQPMPGVGQPMLGVGQPMPGVGQPMPHPCCGLNPVAYHYTYSWTSYVPYPPMLCPNVYLPMPAPMPAPMAAPMPCMPQMHPPCYIPFGNVLQPFPNQLAYGFRYG